jgi:hypothetical protein
MPLGKFMEEDFNLVKKRKKKKDQKKFGVCLVFPFLISSNP